jgi:hypothetical protein
MSRPSHLFGSDHSNNRSGILLKSARYVAPRYMRGSPHSPANHFFPLWSKCSPQHMFSDTLKLCPYLNVRDTFHIRTRQHVQLYKYVYFNLCVLDTRCEEKDLELYGSKHAPNLICVHLFLNVVVFSFGIGSQIYEICHNFEMYT